MGITRNTYEALANIKMPDGVDGMERFWEDRGFNPEVIKAFVNRMMASENPIMPEALILMGAQLAEIGKDPSFGLPVAGGHGPANVPHKFERFGRNPGCAVCGKAEAWHLHTAHTDGLRGDADR